MYYTYVLKSLKDGRFYYGSTQILAERLKEHNRGKVKSTRNRVPLIVHYFETYETKHEALRRELFFKSINGYVFLRKRGII